MANYSSPDDPHYKMTPKEAEELRKWEEKSNIEIAKKRERRLGHIQGHLNNILVNDFAEDAGEFQITYEPMTEYSEHGVSKSMYSRGGKVKQEHSPAFRFVLTRKDNPDEKYEILSLLKQDVDRNVKVADIPGDYQLIGLGNEHIKKGIEKLRRKQSKGLEDTPGIVSIILITASLFFLSSNLTGNAIANLTKINSDLVSLFGLVLFILGIILTFVYFMKK